MKSTINKQQLFIEFISVVFAVILALILNSWRESAAQNSNVNKVKEAIRKEVVKNDSLFRESYAYRKALLSAFYANENLLYAAPVAEFPVDVNDNAAVASFFRTSLLFGQKEYFAQVEVQQQDSLRVLVLDERVYDLQVRNDTIKLLGIGNVQLRTPDFSNNAWQLAQATNAVVHLDVSLVEKLSTVDALIRSYENTSAEATQMIYLGKQKGLLPVIEDMYSTEAKIIKANAALLEELK